MDTKLLHKNIEGFLTRTKAWSHETNKLASQLKKEGVEITDSKLGIENVVISIWCLSQAALENIQTMYESSHLKSVFLGIASNGPSNSDNIPSKLINIESDQFKRTVGMSV